MLLTSRDRQGAGAGQKAENRTRNPRRSTPLRTHCWTSQQWHPASSAGLAAGTVSENELTAAAGFDLTAQLADVGRHWFQGRELDAWTNFYYVRARWLDPLTGTWLSEDPIRHLDDWNLARFVKNDPVNATDPTGLATVLSRPELAAPPEERPWGFGEYLTSGLGWLQAAGGVTQIAQGGVEAFGGGAAAAPTLGASLVVTAHGVFTFVRGVDNTQAGVRQGWTGEPTPTVLNSVVTRWTGDPRIGAGADVVADLLTLNPAASGRSLMVNAGRLGSLGDDLGRAVAPAGARAFCPAGVSGAPLVLKGPPLGPGQLLPAAAKEATTLCEGQGGGGQVGGSGVPVRTTWPRTADEMDDFLGVPGQKIPDGPTTPGRDKTVWHPNANTKITLERHPYHPDAPDWHRDYHWHLDTPENPHQRFLPGDPIPNMAGRGGN